MMYINIAFLFSPGKWSIYVRFSDCLLVNDINISCRFVCLILLRFALVYKSEAGLFITFSVVAETEVCDNHIKLLNKNKSNLRQYSVYIFRVPFEISTHNISWDVLMKYQFGAPDCCRKLESTPVVLFLD
jgi:hypothetical protein